MGTELDQTRLAALHQAAHDLKNTCTTPEEVVERANVYLGFLTAGDAASALEKTRLIARGQWDFVNDCPEIETMALGEPPVAPHPLSGLEPKHHQKSAFGRAALAAHYAMEAIYAIGEIKMVDSISSLTVKMVPRHPAPPHLSLVAADAYNALTEFVAALDVKGAAR